MEGLCRLAYVKGASGPGVFHLANILQLGLTRFRVSLRVHCRNRAFPVEFWEVTSSLSEWRCANCMARGWDVLIRGLDQGFTRLPATCRQPSIHPRVQSSNQRASEGHRGKGLIGTNPLDFILLIVRVDYHRAGASRAEDEQDAVGIGGTNPWRQSPRH